MRVCHEVDEFGGQMLGGVGRWLGAVLLLPVGEGRGRDGVTRGNGR